MLVGFFIKHLALFCVKLFGNIEKVNVQDRVKAIAVKSGSDSDVCMVLVYTSI